MTYILSLRLYHELLEAQNRALHCLAPEGRGQTVFLVAGLPGQSLWPVSDTELSHTSTFRAHSLTWPRVFGAPGVDSTGPPSAEPEVLYFLGQSAMT